MKSLIAGNWKMNGNLSIAENLAQDIVDHARQTPEVVDLCDLLVCPGFAHLTTVAKVVQGSSVLLGAQDCSAHEEGAFTGDVSATMLADLGCQYVILGHSERRSLYGETDEVVAQKAEKAHAAGLTAIICVGEREEEREAGIQEKVVAAQLQGSLPDSASDQNIVIAYEPVWAIGTGKSASPDDVADMHRFIREQLGELLSGADSVPILYGGSMKPDNAADILSVPDVNGGLIGGASLRAEQFMAIAKSVQN